MDFGGEAQYAYFFPNFEADMLIVYAYRMLNVICTKFFSFVFTQTLILFYIHGNTMGNTIYIKLSL